MTKEYSDYRKALSKARVKLKEEADLIHIKAEEEWMKNYTKEQEEKWIRDMDKWRTSVCRIAMHTKKTIEYMQEKGKILAERHKRQTAKMAQDSFERRLMLDALEIEGSNWPTIKNSTKILSETAFPATLFESPEYVEHMNKVEKKNK